MALDPTVPSINAFGISPVQGELDQTVPGHAYNCAVSVSAASNLVPGQAVKLEDSAGGVPKVLPLAADTDATWGFVIGNTKDVVYKPGDYVTIARSGSIMWLEANAAIARGGLVQTVNATNRVVTKSANGTVGQAYDKATAAGQLIRVEIRIPVA